MTGSYRIGKSLWYRLGGFRNSRLWRRQGRRGGWQYYVRAD